MNNYDPLKRFGYIVFSICLFALSACTPHEQMDQEEGIVEIDRDLICHTLQGKPIKPKTLGQKKYVDSIREGMITFGLGPAGTGKTY